MLFLRMRLLDYIFNRLIVSIMCGTQGKSLQFEFYSIKLNFFYINHSQEKRDVGLLLYNANRTREFNLPETTKV